MRATGRRIAAFKLQCVLRVPDTPSGFQQTESQTAKSQVQAFLSVLLEVWQVDGTQPATLGVSRYSNQLNYLLSFLSETFHFGEENWDLQTSQNLSKRYSATSNSRLHLTHTHVIKSSSMHYRQNRSAPRNNPGHNCIQVQQSRKDD